MKILKKEIDCAATLTNGEVRAWYNLLWSWINCNDHSYDLYEFVRDNLNEEYGTVPTSQEWEKGFMELLQRYLADECGDILADYEQCYEKKKQEVNVLLKTINKQILQ